MLGVVSLLDTEDSVATAGRRAGGQGTRETRAEGIGQEASVCVREALSPSLSSM